MAARVALARRVAAETAALSADSAAQAWLATAAGDAGLLLEEATAAEVGGMGEALAAGLLGRARGPDTDFLEDEEERREAVEGTRERRGALRAAQRALDALLAQPLVPTGTSRRFITANPVLAPSAPLPAAVVLGDAGSGGRSGNALVAPRVALPGAGARGGSGGAAGRGGALRALAERGRLAHVPALAAAASARSKTAQRKRRR